MKKLLHNNVKAKISFIFLLLVGTTSLFGQTNAWLNELHYQNSGADINQAVEIVIENPGTLSDYLIELYDANGNVYNSETIDNFQVGESINAFTIYYWYPPTIENLGGIAISYQGNLISGQFLSYGGTITATNGAANGLTSEDIGVSESNSTPGTSTLELYGNGNSYDDFEWSPYSTIPSFSMQTFGNVNTIQTIGNTTNTPPFIQSVTQNPTANMVTSSSPVHVTATVVDVDDLASVTLKWEAFNSTQNNPSLSNSIPMNPTSGQKFKTATPIPAQLQNKIVYYRVVATDNAGQTTISNLYSYGILPDNPSGLPINAINSRYFINFDETVANVNNSKYQGLGLKSIPAAGQLDSDAFKIYPTGNPQNVSFGGDYTSSSSFPRYRRGESTGNVTTEGFYAFTVATNNNAFGVQPGGSGFSEGKIILRIQNTSGVAINSLAIAYKLFAFNDQARSTEINFSYGTTEQNLSQLSNLNYSTPTTADSSPKWKGNYFKTDIENISIPANGVYYLVWSFKDKSSTATGARDEFALDDIEIIANSSTLTNQLSGPINDVRMDGNVTLSGPTKLSGNLSIISGELSTNNNLTFGSSAEQTGTVGNLSNGTITGQVTVERFFTARRAFRFVSSAVNSSESILENWQEGADTNTENPVPGYGTHITGSMSGADGFDATPSGNPSLFTYDNENQSWNSIPNTNNTFISAGEAFRLMVRGDRSVDVTDNETPPTITRIRTRGSLISGDKVLSDLGTDAGDYNFIGNPYQAVVDFASVLNNSTNVNENNYYVWNVNLAVRGAYETIDLSSNPTAYLQPGQAVFVRTLNDGNASVLFQENNKVASASTANTVFSGSNKSTISIDLFSEENIANNLQKSDNVTINFTENDSDAILPNDATKMGNLDENLAVVQDGNYLSLEYRSLPTTETIIPLFGNQYRSENYRFKVNVQNFEDLTPYLVDKFTNNEYELSNAQQTEVLFTINEASENSIASDRFEIHFKENSLGVKELHTSSIAVYPNPIENNQLFIDSEKVSGVQNTIRIYNQLGQLVYSTIKSNETSKLLLNDLNLSSGLFILQLENENGSWTKKLIVK